MKGGLEWIAQKDVVGGGHCVGNDRLYVSAWDGVTWQPAMTVAEQTIWWFLHGRRFYLHGLKRREV